MTTSQSDRVVTSYTRFLQLCSLLFACCVNRQLLSPLLPLIYNPELTSGASSLALLFTDN